MISISSRLMKRLNVSSISPTAVSVKEKKIRQELYSSVIYLNKKEMIINEIRYIFSQQIKKNTGNLTLRRIKKKQTSQN